jgi:hypothetical protein
MNTLTKSSNGIAAVAIIDTAIGLALNNIALGIGIGIVFSAAFVSQSKIKNSKN